MAQAVGSSSKRQAGCGDGKTLVPRACLPKAAVRDNPRMIDVATPERTEEITARWPDAQHWGIEICALMPSGGGED